MPHWILYIILGICALVILALAWILIAALICMSQ